MRSLFVLAAVALLACGHGHATRTPTRPGAPSPTRATFERVLGQGLFLRVAARPFKLQLSLRDGVPLDVPVRLRASTPLPADCHLVFEGSPPEEPIVLAAEHRPRPDTLLFRLTSGVLWRLAATPHLALWVCGQPFALDRAAHDGVRELHRALRQRQDAEAAQTQRLERRLRMLDPSRQPLER